jgi:enterochelin esterase-like enzyme
MLGRNIAIAAWLASLLAAGCSNLAEVSPRAATPASENLVAPELAPTAILPVSPTATAAPTPDCRQSPGKIQSGAYRGFRVEFEVPYRIYLPACYGKSDEPLPTLYVFHGFPFDETHWESLGVQDRADALIASGQIKPLAIVMPRLPEPLFRSSDGGPWSYEAEMLEGLIPAIEAAYLVQSAGQARAVAGISRGGVWSLEIGMTHPEAFAAAVALSPALSVNAARPEYDPLLLSQLGPMPIRFMLVAGDTDWAAPLTRAVAERLAASQSKATYLELPGGHESSVWQASMDPILTYVNQSWAEGPPEDMD